MTLLLLPIMVYDNMNRVLAVNYSDVNTPNVTFIYDAAGRLTEMFDGLGATTFGYDDLDRMVSMNDPLNNTLGYGYDAGGRRADGSRDRRLQTYLRPQVLVLDDFGLRPLQPPGPEDLYDLIDGRYERGSILLTSNRAPSEWPDLLGDPLLASAGLDRLLHHADILVITGDSFRARGRQPLAQEVPLAQPAAIS